MVKARPGSGYPDALQIDSEDDEAHCMELAVPFRGNNDFISQRPYTDPDVDEDAVPGAKEIILPRRGTLGISCELDQPGRTSYKHHHNFNPVSTGDTHNTKASSGLLICRVPGMQTRQAFNPQSAIMATTASTNQIQAHSQDMVSFPTPILPANPGSTIRSGSSLHPLAMTTRFNGLTGSLSPLATAAVSPISTSSSSSSIHLPTSPSVGCLLRRQPVGAGSVLVGGCGGNLTSASTTNLVGSVTGTNLSRRIASVQLHSQTSSTNRTSQTVSQASGASIPAATSASTAKVTIATTIGAAAANSTST
ncbi:unnamed protein product, partial [Protopolystoma xenopodis]